MVFFLNQLAHYWCAPARGCALQLALCCGGGGGGGDGGGGVVMVVYICQTRY